jgi:predicted TIM-barrel fold metal-dependent hydrolase
MLRETERKAMADIPFVDTHVHFYDLKDETLYYSWLQRDWVHPILGNIDPLKALRYDADCYIAETRFANVTKAVHVQAALGIEDPVRETEWLEKMADRTGFPQAIIAYSDLARPNVEAELERHAAYPRVRGIRDFGHGDYLVDPAWERGFALLEKFGMLLDLDCTWENMKKARNLADRHPGIPVVLEHAGFPRARTEEYFRNWRSGLTELARAGNALCKISGLGMCDPRWSVESIRPWVSSCIEIFGVERCFFGTNWPVDRLYSSYDPVVNAYAEIIGGFSQGEKEALFFRNAERTYRI